MMKQGLRNVDVAYRACGDAGMEMLQVWIFVDMPIGPCPFGDLLHANWRRHPHKLER